MGSSASGGRSPIDCDAVGRPVAASRQDPHRGAGGDRAGRDGGRDRGGAFPAHRATCSRRNPGADPGHDLVADRLGHAGELLRGDACLPGSPDQDDVVAGLHRDVAAIDDQLIHGHAPRHPASLAPDHDVGPGRQEVRVAVGVAHRHRRHVRVAIQPVPMSVRHAFPGGKSLGQRDRRAPREGRAEPEVARRPQAPAPARRSRSPSGPGRGGSPDTGSWRRCSRRAGGSARPRGSHVLDRPRGTAPAGCNVVFSSSAELAKCVHSASRRRPLAINRSTNAGRRLRGIHAGTVHARCRSSRVHRRLTAGGGRCQALERRLGVQAGGEPGFERRRLGPGRELRQDQDGASIPASRRRSPSSIERNADPRRRRPRARHARPPRRRDRTRRPSPPP